MASSAIYCFCVCLLNSAKKHRPALMPLFLDKTTELNEDCLKSRPVERALVW
jgi:hypothetical protein